MLPSHCAVFSPSSDQCPHLTVLAFCNLVLTSAPGVFAVFSRPLLATAPSLRAVFSPPSVLCWHLTVLTFHNLVQTVVPSLRAAFSLPSMTCVLQHAQLLRLPPRTWVPGLRAVLSRPPRATVPGLRAVFSTRSVFRHPVESPGLVSVRQFHLPLLPWTPSPHRQRPVVPFPLLRCHRPFPLRPFSVTKQSINMFLFRCCLTLVLP
jgi:hypothetical protein